VTFPGTAKTSRFCSSAQRAVMRVPLYSAASTTKHSHRHAADDAIADRKILRSSEGSQREFGDERASQRDNLLGEARVFLGIRYVDTCAEHGDRLALCVDRAAMRGGVYAAHHAALNDKSTGARSIASRSAIARAIRRRMARAHHRDAGLSQDVNRTTPAKHDRRIADLLETGRVRGIFDRNQVNTSSGRARRARGPALA